MSEKQDYKLKIRKIAHLFIYGPFGQEYPMNGGFALTKYFIQSPAWWTTVLSVWGITLVIPIDDLFFRLIVCLVIFSLLLGSYYYLSKESKK